MTEGRDEFHVNSLLVQGFLGGVAFAGLIFALGSQSALEKSVWGLSPSTYFSIVILLLGLTSVVEIFGSLVALLIVGGYRSAEGWAGTFSEWSLLIGVIQLFLVIPFLVAGVNSFLGVAFLIYDTFLWAILAMLLSNKGKQE